MNLSHNWHNAPHADTSLYFTLPPLTLRGGVLFVVLLLLCSSAHAQDLTLTRFEKIRSDPQLRSQLEEMVKDAVRVAFQVRAGLKPAPTGDLDPLLQDPLPLFITAKKGEKVRGCIGGLETKTSSLAGEIEKNLRLAFTQDPRHPPIQKDELPGMEIFVTAVGRPIPVARMSEISPARDGMMIRSGGKEAVVLPGEAKTNRYLLAFAKAKAGIKRGEGFQIYRIPTRSISFMIDQKH